MARMTMLSPEPKMPVVRCGTLTPEIEAEQRAAVIAAALSWCGTPYQKWGASKGGGVDCAMLLVRVWVEAGVVEEFDPRPYPPEWHLHNHEERYLSWMIECASSAPDPKPGDIMLVWYGRCFSHGAIITAPGRAVHSPVREGICCEAELDHPDLLYIDAARKRLRPRLFFDVWARIRERQAGG